MSTRADRYTQLQKVPDIFSDFLTDLTPHPITRDVTRYRNEQSIKQSIKNLILTNYNERPFQPNIGSRIESLLFEPVSYLTASSLQSEIQTVIRNFEPRVRLNTVTVYEKPDDNAYEVTVDFYIGNNSQPTSVNLTLERTR